MPCAAHGRPRVPTSTPARQQLVGEINALEGAACGGQSGTRLAVARLRRIPLSTVGALLLATALACWGLGVLLWVDPHANMAQITQTTALHTAAIANPFGRPSGRPAGNNQAALTVTPIVVLRQSAASGPAAMTRRSTALVARLQQAIHDMNSGNAATLAASLELMDECGYRIAADLEQVQAECDALYATRPTVVAMLQALAQTGQPLAQLKSIALEHASQVQRYQLMQMEGRMPDNLERVLTLQAQHRDLAKELNRPDQLPLTIEPGDASAALLQADSSAR